MKKDSYNFPYPGEIYSHYKGKNVVIVDHIAENTENGEMMIIYHHIAGDTEKIWARPLSVWQEIVKKDDNDINRFSLCKKIIKVPVDYIHRQIAEHETYWINDMMHDDHRAFINNIFVDEYNRYFIFYKDKDEHKDYVVSLDDFYRILCKY